MSAVDLLSGPAIVIRDACAEDVHAITSLYAWHVLHGRASFEEVPPTVDEMHTRMNDIANDGLPWLVALYQGIVVGYCYARLYRPRPAYRYTLEESIYIDASMTGRGLGSILMNALIERCEQGPWRQMIAVVGDGHNNPGSLRLHQKYGFEIAGHLRSVGYKKGNWRDTLIMQRPLNEGDWTLPE
ncbi:N-acetyltransferase family protein [Salmonella enterica]